MDRNVGGLDRTIRFVVATLLIVYGFRNRKSILGRLAFIGGSDLMATTIVQWCPVNALFGIDTCPGA